jgi:hypothetical protein
VEWKEIILILLLSHFGSGPIGNLDQMGTFFIFTLLVMSFHVDASRASFSNLEMTAQTFS